MRAVATDPASKVNDQLEESELAEQLTEIPPGTVPPDQKRNVEQALAEVWESLEGSGAGGMEGYKIINRTESLAWDPPHLRFEIERHGATVLGSIYAHVQPWTVDVEAGTARCGRERRRLVDAGRLRERERRAREKLVEWIETDGEPEPRTLKLKGRGYVDALPLSALTREVRQVMADCAKGSYQAELISGARGWADVPSVRWGSQYRESRANLLDRLREATEAGTEVNTQLALDGSKDHPRWTLRLVIERADGIYIQ